jgi:hypothetical protein
MRPVPAFRPIVVALALALACAGVAADLDAKRITLESRVEGLALSGELAALATSGGLVLMDVSTPSAPRRLGALPLTGGSGAVALRGGHAFVACGAEGLVVADVSDRTAPVARGRLDTDGGALDVLLLDENRALVADGTMGVKLADLGDPAAPKILAALDTGGYPRSLAPHPAGALVAAGHGGLIVLQLPNEGAPTVLGRLAARDARAVAAADDGATVFLADGPGGMVVVDLSRPEAPREAARFALAPGEVHDVLLLSGSTLALAMGRGGLRVVEVRDERLREIAVLPMDRPAVELARAGRVVFVANDSGGLAAVDLSRADRPRLITPAPGP